MTLTQSSIKRDTGWTTSGPDEFSPGGNPQDRFVAIDPAKYLPTGFAPVYSDPVDANATLTAVATDTANLLNAGGSVNEVINALLGIVGTAFGATIKTAI